MNRIKNILPMFIILLISGMPLHAGREGGYLAPMIERGDVDGARRYIESRPEQINRQLVGNKTALEYALALDKYDIVKVFVDNLTNEERIECLLRPGMQLSQTTDDIKTHPEIQMYLHNKLPAIFGAIHHKNVGGVKQLITENPLQITQSYGKYTPFIFALRSNHQSIATLLIDQVVASTNPHMLDVLSANLDSEIKEVDTAIHKLDEKKSEMTETDIQKLYFLMHDQENYNNNMDYLLAFKATFNSLKEYLADSRKS